MDSRYQSRANEEVYTSIEDTAHVGLQNLHFKSIEEHLDQLINQNNVFCGHWLEYVQLKESKLIDYFPNRTFCVIQMPTVGDKLYRRLLSKNSGATPWLLHEVDLLYRKQHIEKLIDEQESSFVYVWTRLLANCNITVLLDDINNQGLDIKVDIEKAQHWHNLWIAKNFENNSD